ncbi:PSD1 and planctomycete cytochrome C domain-containing protein [soil metagenome]
MNDSKKILHFSFYSLFSLCALGALGVEITASDHWAFVPPTRSEVPEVEDRDWVRNPIDAFLLSDLEAFEISPAPEADRATLLRRLSFGLIGLPPTPDEIDAFLNDDSESAYEKIVDRLLSSPHYGERWAQHWLDLARYADTDGYELDHTRPDMWRYRDWVIEALNNDLPYDQFLTYQMAGDEVAPDDPKAAVATGFHRAYPDMVDINDQNERRQMAMDDIVETTGSVFLALTIGCARCHDHKFDPIRQVDFYQLQAFFTPARFLDDYVVVDAEQRAEHDRQVRRWRSARAEAQADLIRLEAPAREQLAPGPPPKLDDRETAAFEKAEADRSPEEVGRVFDALARDDRVQAAQIEEILDSDAAATRADWLERLEALQKSEPSSLPLARVLDETGRNAPPTHLLIRGQFGQIGPEVPPAFPAVLASSEAEAVPEIIPGARSTGRRAALAAWLTRPDHPLTTRVIVNRLWQHHFGRGIVETPSDFGTMGIEPTHPALLDWLATELVDRGWSLKEMHRLIVTSSAYRMSTQFDPETFEADPENVLFWRQNRQRLDGEAIRDAILAVSGLLHPELGGPPVFPELPPELTKLSSKGAIWPVSPRAEDRNRRGLYVFVRRNLRYPFFEAFDRPDTNASCPQRSVTTIAPQALALLNDPIAHQAANALAERVEREAGPGLADRIARAYRLALGRDPDEQERRIAEEFLKSEGDEAAAWTNFCLALLNVNEFVYLD